MHYDPLAQVKPLSLYGHEGKGLLAGLTTQLSEQKQAYRDVSAKLEELKEQQEAGVANKFSQTEQGDPASPVPSGPLGSSL